MLNTKVDHTFLATLVKLKLKPYKVVGLKFVTLNMTSKFFFLASVIFKH